MKTQPVIASILSRMLAMILLDHSYFAHQLFIHAKKFKSNRELFYTLIFDFTISISPQRKNSSYSAVTHNNLKRIPSSQQHPRLVRCTASFCIVPNFYTVSDEGDGGWQKSFKHLINLFFLKRIIVM